MYDDLTCEVEQFLYREARLLDERRFHEWLELFTKDARYWRGGRSNRYPKSSKAIAILDPDRHVEDDLTKEGELAILDETRETLARRVARLETGMAWAEDPPSRTRHLIANIEVEPGDAVSKLKVYCNFIVYRSRAETEQDFYVGARRDVFREWTARSRSPAARSPSIRTCCRPRTSASSFRPGVRFEPPLAEAPGTWRAELPPRRMTM
jgi:3-phenylpropionate/cinnamic acid dioxygenase small subunit